IVSATGDEQRRALIQANKGSCTVELTRSLIGQGAVLSGNRKYSQAIDVFRLAEELARQSADLAGLATCPPDQAVMFDHLGKYSEALSYCEKSLAIAKEIGDDLQAASAFYTIGNVNIGLGRLDQAADNYRKSLAITEMTGDRQGTARALYTLA